MIQIQRPNIGAAMISGTEVDASLRLAFARTVLRHRRLGIPMAVWQDGQVAELSADLVILDPATEAAARDESSR